MKHTIFAVLISAGMLCGCAGTAPEAKEEPVQVPPEKTVEKTGEEIMTEPAGEEETVQCDFTILKPVEATTIQSGSSVPSEKGYFLTMQPDGSVFLLDADANPAPYPAFKKAWLCSPESQLGFILIQEDENGFDINLPASYASDGIMPEYPAGIGGVNEICFYYDPAQDLVFQKYAFDPEGWVLAEWTGTEKYVAVSTTRQENSYVDVFEGTYYIWDTEEDIFFGPYTGAQGVWEALPTAAPTLSFTSNYFPFSSLFARKSAGIYNIGDTEYTYALNAGRSMVLASNAPERFERVYFDENTWAALPENCTMISEMNDGNCLLEVDGIWYLASLDQTHTDQ